MTDSDSDYSFESADEGEGTSPRKEKHHPSKLDENPPAESVSIEKGGEGDQPTAPTNTLCDAIKELQLEDTQDVKTDSNSSQETLRKDNSLAFDVLTERATKHVGSQEKKNSVSKNEGNSTDTCATEETGNRRDDHFDTSEEVAEGESRTSRLVNEKDNNLEFASVLDKMAQSEVNNTQQSSGWGWSSWGMSVLSTATSSVSTFTSQVGEGFSTVLESVESTFGAPAPEELAKEEAERLKSVDTSDEKSTAENVAEDESQASFMGLITGVSGVIEKTGTKVLSSGLDTLEFLGKKTMDVLQENDPGLKKKRGLFHGSKLNLSEALREAKLKAENEDCLNKSESEEPKIHYTKLFDDFQGLVHLEALEMLSKQCEARLPSLTSAVEDNLAEEQMSAISSFCELEDVDDESDEEDHNFTELAAKLFSELPVTVNSQKLIQAHEKSRTWLMDSKETEHGDKPSSKEMHAHALEALANLTAKGVELFHKTSELILSTERSQGSKAAEVLASIAKLICKELNVVAAKYCDMINGCTVPSETDAPNNSLITEIFLEASNSNIYIQDALKLTSPVLQAALLENLSNPS